MLTLDSVCTHAMRFLHTAVRVYDRHCTRIIYKGDENIADPLRTDIDFEEKLLHMANGNCPVIFSENELVHYAVIRGDKMQTIIIGPVCRYEDIKAGTEYTRKQHHIDNGTFFTISAAQSALFYETVLLLFHYISDKPMTKEDMLLGNISITDVSRDIDRHTMNIYTEYREHGKVHNPYAQEQREQESIRTGDMEALKRSINETYEGDIGKMALSGLRSAKNVAISVLAVSSRSAIAGGILPEVSFSLADAYSMKIEEMNTEAEVQAVLRTAEFHYTSLVHEHLCTSMNNPVLLSIKDYVVKHINEKITLSEIADALEMNASYVSDLFSRQENMTLSEYISREKLSHAKRRLIYTNDTYGQIAYDFAFSSQSHFGKVFKKYTGMTPKEFREQHKSKGI